MDHNLLLLEFNIISIYCNIIFLPAEKCTQHQHIKYMQDIEIRHIKWLDIYFRKQDIYPNASSALRTAIIQQLPQKVKAAARRRHPDNIIKSEKTTFPPLIAALTNENCSEEIIKILLEENASTKVIKSEYVDCKNEKLTSPIYMCTNPKFVELLIKKGNKTPEQTLHCILTLLRLIEIGIKVSDEMFKYWFDKMKTDVKIGQQINQLEEAKKLHANFFSIKIELFHKFFHVINEFHKDSIGAVFYLCLQNPKFLVSILKNFKIDEEIIQNLARFSYYGEKFPFFIIDELCTMDIFYKRASFNELLEELIHSGVKPGPKSIQNLLLNTDLKNEKAMNLLIENGGKLNSSDQKFIKKYIAYAPVEEIENMAVDWRDLKYFIKLLKYVPVSTIKKFLSSGKLDKISFQNLLNQFELHHLIRGKNTEEILIYLVTNFNFNTYRGELLSVCPTKNIVLLMIKNRIPLPFSFTDFDKDILQNIEILQILLNHGVKVDNDISSAIKLIPYPQSMKLLLPKYDLDKLTNSFAREGNLMHFCVCYLGRRYSQYYAKDATLENVQIILDCGWDVNKICCARKKKKNPLAHALKRNDSTLFNLLLDYNADPSICFKNKMYPLSTDGRVWEIIILLLSQRFDTCSNIEDLNSIPDIFLYSLTSPRRSILLNLFKRLPENQIQMQKYGQSFVEFALIGTLISNSIISENFSNSEISDVCEAINKSGLSTDDIEELMKKYSDSIYLCGNLKRCIYEIRNDVSRTMKSARSVYPEEELPCTKKQKLNGDVSHLE